jgi:hypothetical protein
MRHRKFQNPCFDEIGVRYLNGKTEEGKTKK